MSAPSYPSLRLFVESQPLGKGAALTLSEPQSHYVAQVMRRKIGDALALFNGEEGEWLAVVAQIAKKAVTVEIHAQLRVPAPSPDLWLIFAPIKQGRIDWLVEKATELGVSTLCPVTTSRTIVHRINEERLRAHAIEAAEQCERLDVPLLHSLQPLGKILGGWPADRLLLVADETGGAEPMLHVLDALPAASKMALLTGPEGGFTGGELEMLRCLPYVKGVTLGPRILRADTASLAALACIQAVCGDWKSKPVFRGHAVPL